MPNEVVETWRRNPALRGSLAPLSGSRYNIVDCHLHVVNFGQEAPGGQALMDAMDRAGVEKAVRAMRAMRMDPPSTWRPDAPARQWIGHIRNFQPTSSVQNDYRRILYKRG